MIESIYIKNFGIVEETEFRPLAGFNVVTGETGAGKSMIIGAINLLMGQRLGGIILPDPEQKAVLEMTVSVDDSVVNTLFSKYDIDKYFPVIIRREISNSGRSRTFINDSPVPVNALKDFALRMIDLSKQHENLSLSNHESRIELIDDYAENQLLRDNYLGIFYERSALLTEIEKSESNLRNIKAEQDFIQFQLEELKVLNYQLGEQIDLESEMVILEHAEDVKQSLFLSYSILDSEEGGMLSNIEVLIQSLKPAAKHHPDAALMAERLKEIAIELRDINFDLQKTFENTDLDENRLFEIEERLNQIYRLIKKHNLTHADELIPLRNDFVNQLQSVDNLEEYISELKKKLQLINRNFDNARLALHNSREKIIEKLKSEIESRLRILAMPDAKFQISISNAVQCNESGCDTIDFYFTANKGVDLQPLSKVASGGELSRLMLAIKSIIGLKKQLPTLIFDEIDTGISGETATKVGQMMKDLSKSSQLIVISHLPQIAAKAEHHYLVEKLIRNENTYSLLRKIEKDERVLHLATMLSGDKDSFSARKTAEEMLGI